MLAYLVLASKSNDPVDPDLIARFEQDDPAEIPFHPESRIVWRNHNGSVIVFGWQAFTEVAGIGSHWVVDERGLTAFTGHPWPRSTGWQHGAGQSWAAQLRSYLGDTPDPPALRESLFGQFTILSLPYRGTGWVMPDWATTEQLFVASTGDTMAISNRATLCAQAVIPEGAIPARSLTGAGWLIAETWIVDEETGYWDVERLDAGDLVVIDPETGAHVVEAARSPMLPAVDDLSRSYDDILAEVECDLRATIRAIATLPIEDRMLSLSGGKDSRTLAALIISEGLQDRFRFATHGSPERADAMAAQAIATRFGLDWSLADATARSTGYELENVRLHTWLLEGVTSAWGSFVRPAFAPTAVVSGVAGEVLRWGPIASSARNAASADDVIAGLRKASKFDPLGVLKPDAHAYYQGWIEDWVREQVERGIPFRSISAVHKHESVTHNRNGPDYSWSPRPRLSPYIAPSCTRSNHWLPIEQRPDYRFHMDLQRAGSIELSKMPLAESTWSEAAFRHLPDAEDYRQIQPIVSLNADGRTWRQKRYSDYRQMIEPILLDRANPIHQFLDYDRLVDRVATADVHAGRTRLIWGVLTAAIWMGEMEQPLKLERPSAPIARSGI